MAACLYWFSKEGFTHKKSIYWPLHMMVNGVRSIPFIILMVLLMPLTRLCVGTSIGTVAAVVPLSIAGIILTARIVEESLLNASKTLIEVGQGMGASSMKTLIKIMFPEMLPQLIQGFTGVLLTLVAYSAMAGAIGGGGLGDLAIRYGYQRYETQLMIVIVVILIVMVQGLQMVGDVLYRNLKK